MLFHFYTRDDGTLEIRARMEGDGAVGDFCEEIKPGETWQGMTYDAAIALGDGEHDIDVAPGQPATA